MGVTRALLVLVFDSLSSSPQIGGNLLDSMRGNGSPFSDNAVRRVRLTRNPLGRTFPSCVSVRRVVHPGGCHCMIHNFIDKNKFI